MPCHGGEACVTLRPLGLCRREPCAPGRSNYARLVCAVRVQTKAAPAGEPYKPRKGKKKPDRKTTGPPGYGAWAVGQLPAPRKSRRLPKLYLIKNKLAMASCGHGWTNSQTHHDVNG